MRTQATRTPPTLPGTRHPDPVAVLAATSARGDAAVRWAAREAERRDTDLRVVLPGDRDVHARSVVDRARATARSVAPGAVVAPGRAPLPGHRPDLVHRSRAASAEAGLLVLPEGVTGTGELLDTAHCPVVVVPAEGEHRGDPADLPVVLGAGAATDVDTIEFAFAEAELMRSALVVVRAWEAAGADLGRPDDAAFARWDTAHAEVRTELDQQLSACTVAHPDVAVRVVVAQDRPLDLLATLAQRARLLVLGRTTRGPVLARISPSPAHILPARLPCPIVVVPPGVPSLLR